MISKTWELENIFVDPPRLQYSIINHNSGS